jgi:hypothetical protein
MHNWRGFDSTSMNTLSFFKNRDSVTVSNYSICILSHFLKVKRLQTIISIWNVGLEFKKTSNINITKTDNMVLAHLMDAGIDIGKINQKELKLQRIKLR